jgi:hypothetical protein
MHNGWRRRRTGSVEFDEYVLVVVEDELLEGVTHHDEHIARVVFRRPLRGVVRSQSAVGDA